MESTPRPRTDPASGILAALESQPVPSTAEVVHQIDRALRFSGDIGTPAESALETDRAALVALRRCAQPDPVLEKLDHAQLAALAGRCSERLAGAAHPREDVRRDAWDLLDMLRRPALLRRLAADSIPDWSLRILRLVDGSHLTTGRLFLRRAETYGSKVLFEMPQGARGRSLTWRQTAGRVETLARGLLSLSDGEGPAPVAILSENRPEMAILDLACLATGLVNILIPANATASDVEYILRHSGARTLVASTAQQLEKVPRQRDSIESLRHVVVIEPRAAAAAGVASLDEVSSRGTEISSEEFLRHVESVRTENLASVMYTSGTTGNPKGIQFSHRNIVYKRFCRALALPEIGEQDVFLCYLPLYHTFGRFLELMGCVFWGATYCFLDNPSVEALVQGMRRYRPTVFISVPKKWMQLYEVIAQKADPVEASDEELMEATRTSTGGRLRWGLSAAGYLSPEIFRFFQQQGVELLSGFGMTEATGGITMTPPGHYKSDSLGPALPGIELRLADDGELLVKGPYVMMGYLDPPDGEPSFDQDAWFHTGDLMEMDFEGYLRLVDRKKEIYKNVKGETIAPQRVENLFRDLESVGRVFLVGDHREYNTALIYPNPQYREAHLLHLEPSEMKTHFRSLVVSVNKFLAPFERIVDFAIIERDLDPERGELTPKGTPRRMVVERNFADVIRLMYRRADLRVGGVKVTLPNWLFRALGLTAQDILVREERIASPSTGSHLTVRKIKPGLTRVGSCLYRHEPGPLNLGSLLRTPRLWLGNEELVEFVSLDLRSRERPGRDGEKTEWAGRAALFQTGPGPEGRMLTARNKAHLDLMDLHRAALALAARDEGTQLAALAVVEAELERTSDPEEGPFVEAARQLLARAAESAFIRVRRLAFQILVPVERESRFPVTLQHFLRRPGIVLDDQTRRVLRRRELTEPILAAFLGEARHLCRGSEAGRAQDQRAASLLRFLADYGAVHPTKYRRLRAFLLRVLLSAKRESVRREAARASSRLQEGFRDWLGPAMQVAVDPETGREYGWDDVITFERGANEEERRRLRSALEETVLLREAVFLFSRGVIIRLSDIVPGGVSLRLLGRRHGKSVYRVAVQTRQQGNYDLAVNLNLSLDPEEVQEEIRWLVLCADAGDRDPLVEDFGGYWKSHDLWSEEFIPGETLDRALRRISRQSKEDSRFRQLWPFFAWSALSAYLDFWNRTGRRKELADPSTTNVIVPTHDYHTGARIVSISARRAHGELGTMVRRFRENFVDPVETQYPSLRGLVGWDVIFSSVLEVVGEEEGLDLLRSATEAGGHGLSEEVRNELERYLSVVEVRGFLPMRLSFAVKRYRRWAELVHESTSQARARTLRELYETYGLQRLAQAYPEARVRFFRETVFQDAPPPLGEGLEEIIGKLRRRELVGDEVVDAVSDLRSRLDLGEDEDYFLARLSFPHLRPEDAAAFVHSDLGGRHLSEMVVSLQDQEGGRFRVRHVLNPREVGQFHRLFLAAKLDVRFRPEHQHLVAINERGLIIGGIFYELDETDQAAHLEKIVVAERFQKKGVASGLMNEFFARMRARGARTVTTGFFRREYFSAFGFTVERRHGGLVKNLDVA